MLQLFPHFAKLDREVAQRSSWEATRAHQCLCAPPPQHLMWHALFGIGKKSPANSGIAGKALPDSTRFPLGFPHKMRCAGEGGDETEIRKRESGVKVQDASPAGRYDPLYPNGPLAQSSHSIGQETRASMTGRNERSGAWNKHGES